MADFLKRKNFVPKMKEFGKNRMFWNYWKIWSLNCFWIQFLMKVYNIYCILAQIPLTKLWFLMCQNVLGQSCCRIFKSVIFLKESDEITWFLGCWYKFMEVKSWLKNTGVGMVIECVWSFWSQDSKIDCISRVS